MGKNIRRPNGDKHAAARAHLRRRRAAVVPFARAQHGRGRRLDGAAQVERGEVVLTLLRAGFHVLISDSDALWTAPGVLERLAALPSINGEPLDVIASGGVGTLDHLVDGVIKGHASAVLAASIFHFGTYSIAEAKAHMKNAGIDVRPSPEADHD